MKVEEKKKYKASIGTKIGKTVIVLSALLIITAIAVGTIVFAQATIDRYRVEAYQIADLVASEISTDKLIEYSELIDKQIAGDVTTEELGEMASGSDEYMKVQKELDAIRISMEANDVALIYLQADDFVNYSETKVRQMDLKPLHYFFDSYINADEQFSLGGSWGFKDKFAGVVHDAIVTAKDPSVYTINKGDFGFTIWSLHPICKTDNGTIFSFVEIPMSTLISDIVTFAVALIVVSLLITVVTILLVLKVTVRRIVTPIEVVAEEAGIFVEDADASQGESTLPISDKLSEIKTSDEVQYLSESILKMEIGINKYIDNLTAVMAEKERIGAELNVATQIQADMLPSIFPPFPEKTEFDIYATMDPAKEVGGDFYDFFLVDDNHLGIVMADVSGKGVPAALFMVISKTLIKNACTSLISPAEALAAVNMQLCENNKADMFCTAWLGIMDIATGHIVATNAGHEYPAIRTADGEFELMKDKHGLPLGAMPGSKYKDYEFDLEKGGYLYLYTDGVPEATSMQNELLGTDRMLVALNSDKDATPEQLLKNVKDAIDGFVLEAPQFDDITMLGLKRK